MSEVRCWNDQRSVFKAFLIALSIYIIFFFVRILAFQLFGIWGSYLSNGVDTLIMFMMIPFILLLLISCTVILALFRTYEKTEMVPPKRMVMYLICFFVLCGYVILMLKIWMDHMGFS